MSERIKPTISGSAETMLQSFYARAQYSKSKHNKFYDAKAVELVDKIDYDFSTAARDSTMEKGVIARTVVFDELVKNFIEKNPDCTVVNIACGLDTRFYRMDNGKITWYNLDLPETIAIRNQIFEESGRVSTIGISALDPAWSKEVKVRGKMLFIIEGLSMYLTAEENGKILKIIKTEFANELYERLFKKTFNSGVRMVEGKFEESEESENSELPLNREQFNKLMQIKRNIEMLDGLKHV